MTDFDVRLADSNTNTNASAVQAALTKYIADHNGTLGQYTVFSEYCICVVRVDVYGSSPCDRCACYCYGQLVDTAN